jgi:hypothetical protein
MTMEHFFASHALVVRALVAAVVILSIVAPAWAEDGFSSKPAVPGATGAATGEGRVSHKVAPNPIGDVALHPGGVLEGRVVSGVAHSRLVGVAGRPVILLRDLRVIARTTTDRDGRFAFQNLTGGLYGVLVDTANGPLWRYSRVWTAEAAPPPAARRLELVIERRLIRGQSPIPGSGFPHGAAITAAAAGAIALPIIYHTNKRDGYIPASP